VIFKDGHNPLKNPCISIFSQKYQVGKIEEINRLMKMNWRPIIG
jgi:hypothetical protein